MDELNLTPSLTLDAEPSAPTLTLEPEKEEEAPQAKPVSVEETPLSPEEQKMVDDFSEKIDITNSQQVLQYGSGLPEKDRRFQRRGSFQGAHQGYGRGGRHAHGSGERAEGL